MTHSISPVVSIVAEDVVVVGGGVAVPSGVVSDGVCGVAAGVGGCNKYLLISRSFHVNLGTSSGERM